MCARTMKVMVWVDVMRSVIVLLRKIVVSCMELAEEMRESRSGEVRPPGIMYCQVRVGTYWRGL